MKTKLLIMLMAALIFSFLQTGKAELFKDSLNPCWKMFKHDPEKGYTNPDSVMFDSCLCVNGYHCEYVYAKKWYQITFNNKDPFGFPIGPRDTVYEATWQLIDSNLIELRNLFQGLENNFGSYNFQKAFPDEIDSNKIASRTYLIKFESYSKIDSVVLFLKNSGHLLDVYYKNSVLVLDSYQDDNNYNTNILYQNIPNPCYDITLINFEMREYGEVNLYLIDILGNQKKLLVKGLKSPGNYSVDVDTKTLSAGNYIYYLLSNKRIEYKKMIIIK